MSAGIIQSRGAMIPGTVTVFITPWVHQGGTYGGWQKPPVKRSDIRARIHPWQRLDHTVAIAIAVILGRHD